jgi:hypothetical protein
MYNDRDQNPQEDGQEANSSANAERVLRVLAEQNCIQYREEASVAAVNSEMRGHYQPVRVGQIRRATDRRLNEARSILKRIGEFNKRCYNISLPMAITIPYAVCTLIKTPWGDTFWPYALTIGGLYVTATAACGVVHWCRMRRATDNIARTQQEGARLLDAIPTVQRDYAACLTVPNAEIHDVENPTSGQEETPATPPLLTH